MALSAGTAAALLLAGCALARVSPAGAAPFFDGFDRPDGVIASPGARARDWIVTSGELRCRAGRAATDSPVFRLVSRRRDFRAGAVRFSLLNQGLGDTAKTPAEDWDGVHVFVRYQSPYHLYAATVNRRDNTVVVKKKVPGGPSNQGTYHDLTEKIPHRVPYGAWQDVRVEVADEGRDVVIRVRLDGTLVAEARDDGTKGGRPIRRAGRVGVRADNATIQLDDFAVEPPGPPPEFRASSGR